MDLSITSRNFDLTAIALTGFFYHQGYGLQESVSKNLVQGLQFFSIAACIDRIARLLLPKEHKQKQTSLIAAISNALIEEGIYSSLLLTQSKSWFIPRFAAAFAVGLTSTKTLIGRAKITGKETAISALVALISAIAREYFLFSMSALLAANSLTFALVEVSPSQKDTNPLERFSRGWTYKFLSAVFFVCQLM